MHPLIQPSRLDSPLSHRALPAGFRKGGAESFFAFRESSGSGPGVAGFACCQADFGLAMMQALKTSRTSKIGGFDKGRQTDESPNEGATAVFCQFGKSGVVR